MGIKPTLALRESGVTAETCDWCKKPLLDNQDVFFWYGGPTIFMHVKPCFLDWMPRIIQDLAAVNALSTLDDDLRALGSGDE